MTDQQPSDITKIFGDIASESRSAVSDQPVKRQAAEPAAQQDQHAGQGASQSPRHGAKKADREPASEQDAPIVAFEEPQGIDWAAIKGQLIRLPYVGRALRIGMAVLRLPKRLDAITDSISLLTDQNIDLETKLHSEISALQTRQQQMTLAMKTGNDSIIDTTDSDLTSDYFHALAERFRGSYDDVKAKMAQYLPLIAAEAVDFSRYPAVDLACGRCEWSDLLREQGIRCTGVDANPVVLRTAKANDLEVYCGDIYTYLETLADASVGIVSGFHIIEHLPTAQKLQLFKEAERVLIPGGLLILETPNSENPLVSSHYFYLDPSHLNPVPIPALEFMAEHFGFETAAILRHSPMAPPKLNGASAEQEAAAGDDSAEQYLKTWLGREQDYGLLARKKGGPSAPGSQEPEPAKKGNS